MIKQKNKITDTLIHPYVLRGPQIVYHILFDTHNLFDTTICEKCLKRLIWLEFRTRIKTRVVIQEG
jgi:hypothetical protein